MTEDELKHDNAALRERLREAEETLEAIRSGDVDAVVVSGIDGIPQVYALETADQTYRVLVEEMQEGALTMSLHDQILYCNRRLASIVDDDMSHVVGGSLTRFILPAEREKFGRTMRGVGKSEFTICTRNGVLTPAHFSFSKLNGAGGEADTLSCIVTDLTDQKRAGKALEDAHARLLQEVRERERTEAMLRQSQKMEALGQLTGGVAHDFNNLLMAISGGLNMLDRQPDEARLKRLKDGMRQAVERGAGLTKQLLSFSRTKALDAEVVNINRQVTGMRELLDRSLGGSIVVETEFTEDAWPVRIDAGEFELVILNLCVNARDAMADGGTISISARNLASFTDGDLSGDFVSVTVTDSGTGMSEATIARAFEPFFTTKDIGKGSGLGLAQAYGFAHSSGGTLRIESRLGQGTTIELLLPRSFESLRTPEILASPTSPGAAGLRALGRVLLVEDDDTVAEVTGEMLGEIGFEVRRVSNAQQALAALDGTETFTLVFSDVMMPGGMNGIQLVETIMQRKHDAAVLLTSGYAPRFAEKAGLLNIEILAKPFDLQQLEHSVLAAIK
ncbi:PAS domain-containing hybrid sensor histidine kinase/response regulator [Aliirhizobium smilacinae]|uniref:histidine kinase n=1 Tax=Aliirhizobium smilacinae TaxID=1395944 RepID=A0A5C4XPT4_9HYPH|nr:PAS domain-containing hybrid sensor histidine kinase/response regulator [Rhizobium smilacinae]TNM65259.1 response regulator [Rhizobium smilacinae]